MSDSKVLLPAHKPHVRASVMQSIQRFMDANAEHDLELMIRRKPRERSSKQQGALFGLAYKILSEHTGFEIRELHEFYCGEFFGWVEYSVMGRKHSRPRRTTTTDEHGKREVVDTKVMADLFDYVQRRAAEIGVMIPDPDPFWKETKRAA